MEHEKQNQQHLNEVGWLPKILGALFVAVVVYVLGFSAGVDQGEENAAEHWAHVVATGVYGSVDGLVSEDQPDALGEVAETAKKYGVVKDFTIEKVHGVGDVIEVKANRGSGHHREVITMLGGYVVGFSSSPANERE